MENLEKYLKKQVATPSVIEIVYNIIIKKKATESIVTCWRLSINFKNKTHKVIFVSKTKEASKLTLNCN